jgi:hypothetical protein
MDPELYFVGDAAIKRRLVGACSNQSFVANCTSILTLTSHIQFARSDAVDKNITYHSGG